MTHRIISARPLDNMILSVVFQNGIEKEYDVRNLHSILPQFENLEKIYGLFQQVNVDVGGYGVSWNDELDLDAKTIWEDGIETTKKYDVGTLYLLAESLINQADI